MNQHPPPHPPSPGRPEPGDRWTPGQPTGPSWGAGAPGAAQQPGPGWSAAPPDAGVQPPPPKPWTLTAALITTIAGGLLFMVPVAVLLLLAREDTPGPLGTVLLLVAMVVSAAAPIVMAVLANRGSKASAILLLLVSAGTAIKAVTLVYAWPYIILTMAAAATAVFLALPPTWRWYKARTTGYDVTYDRNRVFWQPRR